MCDAVQEIAIYIHRFHNLDLFQQGWYQLKISMRWEDDKIISVGCPARVVQYEAAELGTDEMCGMWTIDDSDNSFTTQPFRIKYVKQDILLYIMISFYLPVNEISGPSSSAVILKFELLQTHISEKGVDLLKRLDAPTVATQEFRITPKALLGLHSYCPVHFDYFHAVLVDTSVHITLVRAGNLVKETDYNTFGNPNCVEDSASGINKYDQAENGESSCDTGYSMLVKAFLAARDTLIEDLGFLGKAIETKVDLTGFPLEIDDMEFYGAVLDVDVVNQNVAGQSKPQLNFEKLKSIGSSRHDVFPFPHSLTRNAAARIFNILGSQMSYLWNAFLHFHRSNKTKVLKFLQHSWAQDRKTEWAIWMVHSKLELPDKHVASFRDIVPPLGHHRRVSSLWKLPEDPAHVASTRADLHRRSISLMRINNRSIQDMHVFGDPLKIPIIFVERATYAPRRALSVNSYFRNATVASDAGSFSSNRLQHENIKKLPSSVVSQNSRLLKIVVFVHGFQGHHLDLRLVRNQWLLIDPKADCLMSDVNEEKTSGDFRDMGCRLAQEVVDFIKRKMDKVSRISALKGIKLSFVGHSIGNIIIRAALAESIMEPYLRFLCTYISVSGPHLGYLYSSNSLFNSGLWLMKKIKGAQCIHQLTFTDDPDINNTFLYRLCQQKTLENFRNVVLLSSPQDGYVPYHSARLESCVAASMDNSKRGRAYMDMLNNCLDQIKAPSSDVRLFMRCDVNFDTSSYGTNLNSIIGRTAHIEFLESDIFLKFILWSFPEIVR